MQEELGGAILRRAVESAREAWGDRLIAAHALGSLAHGGFSALVSDVDLGLILADPLADDDRPRAAAIGTRLAATQAPLPTASRSFGDRPPRCGARSRAAGFPRSIGWT